MSASDRQSLQLEIDQMKQQINNVATTTNHNNIKLLDGSAGKVQLQTGVTSGDTMSIGFDSVQTKDIGFGPKVSLSSIGATATKVPALANGDLVLNGVVVGASLATDDSLSKSSASSSAIAKVAAINRVSAQSGVTATVGQTTVYGSAMSASTAAGTVTINGFTTAKVTLGSDTEINRTMMTTAINNLSSQTGVTATNTHDDKQGLILTAADGRNVTFTFDTAAGANLDAAGTGLGAEATYVGTYELSTADSRSIDVSTTTSGTIQNSGLRPGTYVANKAQATTLLRDAAVTVAPTDTTSTTGTLNGNTLVLNGVGVDASIGSDDAASNTYATTSLKSASGIAIAAAINKKSSLTGVTAKADANVIRGTGFTSGAVTALNINGVDITVALASGSTRDDVLSAINAYQGQTGVVASAWGAGVQLTAADGRNISIGSDGSAAALGLTGVAIGAGVTAADLQTYYSTVTLSSDKQFTVASGNEGNTTFAQLGFRRGTFGGANNGVKVADVDVSTQAGAGVAISALDAAIEAVSSMQSRAGAYQNRLEAVVNNLTESNQNMSASRSRILDTDYATETTNLARSQIISQAATAMLAQANQASQSVLALLK
jgi:flagellin